MVMPLPMGEHERLVPGCDLSAMVGSVVRIGAREVGQIVEAEVEDDRSVRVTMELDDEAMDTIGTPVLAVSFGGQDPDITARASCGWTYQGPRSGLGPAVAETHEECLVSILTAKECKVSEVESASVG